MAKKNFYQACYEGDIKRVMFLATKCSSYNWDMGMCEACKGPGNPTQQQKIIDFMIEKGVSNWYAGLAGACREGRLEMAEYMIEKGANCWDNG